MKIQLNSYLLESSELVAHLIGAQSAPSSSSGSTRVSQRRLRTETQPILPSTLPKPTMTARQLARISLDQILEGFCYERSTEFQKRVEKHLPYILEIAAAETEQTFGYHGASQEVRIFQDALKVIYEEKLGIKLPDDFYFLRIPGDSFLYETDNVKNEFLDSRPKLDAQMRAYALDFYILRPLNEEYGLSLKTADFSSEAFEEMDRFVIGMLKKRIFEDWNPFSQSMSILSAPSTLSKEISIFSDLSIDEVNFKLNELRSKNSTGGLSDYLEELYDVKRLPISQMGKEGWDAFLVRDKECREILSQWNEFCYFFCDTNAEGSSKVISMVGPLFGGLEPGGTGESCLGPFLGNSSYEGHDGRLENILNRFCESLGMAKDTGTKLMEAGRQVVYAEGEENVTGVLFQLYDISSDHAVDRVTYLTQSIGHPIHRAQKINTSSYVNGELKDEPGLEIRLIMDNGTSLNPNGSIRMVRYDLLPEGTGEAVLDAMRDVIRGADVDAEKVEQYKAKLNEYW